MGTVRRERPGQRKASEASTGTLFQGGIFRPAIVRHTHLAREAITQGQVVVAAGEP
jgi:hypothetical protein